MSEKKSIYIVYSELKSRRMLKSFLEENEFEMTGSSNDAENAWQEISDLKPDLILLDIHLSGTKNGIWLGNEISDNLLLPFIYISEYDNHYSSQEILDSHPMAFLLKPINFFQLITTINIVLKINKSTVNNHVTIQDGHRSININTDEIVYLKSDGNYVHLFMDHSHFLVRSTLNHFLEFLNISTIQRIHLRYAINLNKKFTINKDIIFIHNTSLNISNSHKLELLSKLK